jgi:soluble lytic murein transglycosylase
VQQESRLSGRQPWQALPQWVVAVLFFSVCALVLAASDETSGAAVRIPLSLSKTQNNSAALTQILSAFALGVDHYSKGRYGLALEALPDDKRSSLTSIGDYIQFYRAKSYLMMDQGNEALSRYRLLLSQFPETPLRRDALIGESLSLLKVHEPKAALSILQNSELGSGSEILFYQAKATEEAGEKEKAIAIYLQIYAGHPDSSFSSEAMRRLAALSPGALAGRRNYNIRLERAENLIKTGNAKDARALLIALGRVPAPEPIGSVKRSLLMGEAEYRLSKPTLALGYLRSVTAAYPQLHARALYLEGVCLRKLNKEISFIELREKALTLYPRSTETEELCYSAAAYYDVNYNSLKAWEAYKALYQNFPKGKYTERALWKLALFQYFTGKYNDAATAFWNYLLAYPNPSSASSAMFWIGRCYQKMGDFDRAKYLYSRTQSLANNSYYGQCAREAAAALEKLDAPGTKADVPIDFDKVMQFCEQIRLSAISFAEPEGTALRAIERARELQEAGLSDLALSELQWGLRRNPENDESLCYLMSQIHEARDDHNKSIASLRKAFPDYNARPINDLPEEIWRSLYPVHYWEVISNQAAKTNLDPTLILSVIRQESGFEEKARSKANALGLMQIIPSTGKKLAKHAAIRNFTAKKLYQADTNITLGVKYLASLLQQYGKEELALAAYNAGDSRVDRWLKEFGNGDMVEFVEQIPFSETRGYVKQVLSNKTHYNLLASLKTLKYLRAK